MNARISVEGLCKYFATPVLKQVSLKVKPASIHGLVGENGAGKSTLINIICGLVSADEGIIKLEGKKFSPATRRDSLNHGIALASQELSIIDTLSVAENILLSTLPSKSIRLDQREIKKHAKTLMESVGLDQILPSTSAAQLSLAEKQLVEVAKALSMPNEKLRLLILDEPTSALTSSQAEQLHRIIKKKAQNGLSVIYISHRLEDVLIVCDEVSVLRDGEIQLSASTDKLSTKNLIRAMSGKDVLMRGDDKVRKLGNPRLIVKNLTCAELPHPISFKCHEGEVLGVAGLSGAGRSELLHAVFGLGIGIKGQVSLIKNREEIEINSASKAVKNGMALIPEDRKSQGIFSDKTISLNTAIAGLVKLGGSLSKVLPKREKRASEELIAHLNIKCDGPLQVIDQLSGGNQQKALIGRWLETKANLWLLDEPTRGVDVGSKLAIHNHLRQLRDKGTSMIIASSELEELTALCDRILVLSNKKAVAFFNRAEWSKTKLLEAAFSEHQGERLAS